MEKMSRKEVTDYSKLPAYEAMKPLMFALRLVGLHYVRNGENDDSSDQTGNKRCRGFSLPTVYCWSMVVFAWTIVICSATGVHNVTSVGPPLFGTLTCLVSFGQYAINATCLARASHNRKGLRKFFICLNELNLYGGLLTPLPWLRKLAISACVAGSLGFALALPFMAYVMFATNTIDFMMGSSPVIFIKLLYIACEAYFIAIWLFVNAFELAIGIFLHHEFRLFQKSLAARTNSATRRFEGSLETERQRYVHMTRVVKAADNTLTLHQAAAFGCNVISICLLLYLMLYYPTFIQNQEAAGFSTFWLLVCTADIVVVSISGILVSSELDKIQCRLQRISLDDVTTCFIGQITMFTSALHTRVGLTVGRLFIIDQTVVLSMVGIVVSYFLVVVQFASTFTAEIKSTTATNSSVDDLRLETINNKTSV